MAMTTRADLLTRDLLASGVRWRVDVPDQDYLADKLYWKGHEFGRLIIVDDVEWIWCKTHREWQPLPIDQHG
jgi:hypothetical protein